MPAGGVLGIPCAHSYAHTSRANQDKHVRPTMLKGVSALLHSSLVDQLHLSVEVKLVADVEDESELGGAQLYVSDVMQATQSSDTCVEQ